MEPTRPPTSILHLTCSKSHLLHFVANKMDKEILSHLYVPSMKALVEIKQPRTHALGKQDFRKFLQQELARRCAKNPGYSLRAFATSLQINPSTLSHILN